MTDLRWPILVAALSLLLSGCEREARRFQEQPTTTTHPDTVRLTTLQPGGAAAPLAPRSPYQSNAYGISEGKRLFSQFNCNGCHSSGGGGIGPALMDDQWIYGYAPEQIYSTIVQGRPDGMPAFAGKIPDEQVWQLVAYVQSLSANTPRDAAGSRQDDMAVTVGESRQYRLTPHQTGHR
jgi:cytochrome c oxidase cbb3-type subunit 3